MKTRRDATRGQWASGQSRGDEKWFVVDVCSDGGFGVLKRCMGRPHTVVSRSIGCRVITHLAFVLLSHLAEGTFLLGRSLRSSLLPFKNRPATSIPNRQGTPPHFRELAGVAACLKEWKRALKSDEEFLFWVGFGLNVLLPPGFTVPFVDHV